MIDKGKRNGSDADGQSASWKFRLENTVNGDPEAPSNGLKIIRAYLDFAGDPGTFPYRAMPDLMAATGLSERTIIRDRKELITLGYMVPIGKSTSGAITYELKNNREVTVANLIEQRAKVLRAEAAERKKSGREGSEPRGVVPPQNDTPAGTDHVSVYPPNVRGMSPAGLGGMSPAKMTPNTVEYSVENSVEGGGAHAPAAVLSCVTISTTEELIALSDDAIIPPAASDEAREIILDYLVKDATFKVSVRAALGGPYDRGKLSKKIARSIIAEFDDPLIDLKETSREHSA